MLIFVTMLVLGMLLGFAGGGGSGFVLALLISVFGIPIHTALGTSIASMVFTVISGSFSHISEGNAVLKTGLVVGLLGAVGAYGGTQIATLLPPNILVWSSAAMLFLSAFLLWAKTRVNKHVSSHENKLEAITYKWVKMPVIGGVTGFLSGCFGIGSTPLIQLGLIVFLKMRMHQVVATSMVILIPISLSGAIGYAQAGYVDWILLLQIVAGTMTGSYIGAKFTTIAPAYLLRTVIIALPVFGGLLLLR